MPQELIDEKFNEFLWRMNSIEKVDSLLEIKLKIAFQEGTVKAQEFVISKFSNK